MIKKIIFFVTTFLLIGSVSVLAQQVISTLDTVGTEVVTQEQLNPFTPKPKNMWELGIQGGTSFISGDVTPKYPNPFGGYSVGLHVRKAIGYAFSWRVQANYAQAKGVDRRLTTVAVVDRDWDLSGLGYAKTDRFMRNYSTTLIEGSVEGVLNVGNILFHRENNLWNLYIFGGLGFLNYQTSVNALDANNNPYDFSGFKPADNKADRKFNHDRFMEMTDKTFETDVVGTNTGALLLLFNDNNWVASAVAGVGFTRKITDLINIGLEHKVIFTGTDNLDGYSFRTLEDRSNFFDLVHTSTVQLNFNLGSKSKRVEPLYWVNPLLAPYSDIAEVKARPSLLDLVDSDGDGVPDIWDEEPNTPAGVIVDVKGRAIDSDGDGIPDYLDKEPFSPKGYDVDDNGVAIISDPYLTESQVNALIANAVSTQKINWFLPMVHFDLDKYYIKPEFIPQLRHVAVVLNENPDIKIVVKGHTDNRAASAYNTVLSYNRAEAVVDFMVKNFNISRDRLLINYSGQDNPLISGLTSSHNIDKREEYKHYMNRRVEFSVAASGDKEMSRPDGPDAGSSTPGSSRAGDKYSGNRNSGY